MILFTLNGESMVEGVFSGVALQAIILDLCEAQVSGRLICKIEGATKTLNIWKGRIASASSSLVDDRMGEVIYREGKLSLDAFVSAAGKVSGWTRFGDILLKSGLFTTKDLWEALCNQTKAILGSLCFYAAIEVSFESDQKPPKMEYNIFLDLKEIFEKSLVLFRSHTAFEAAAMANPTLELDESALVFADNDFLKDMVVLIRDSGNFITIVDKDSRLSKINTIGALYELYLRGILKDTLQLAQAKISPSVDRDFREICEEANFMFAELANAAKVEEIQEWGAIVAGANLVLCDEIGMGMHLTSPLGFAYPNILRSFILHPRNAEKSVLKYSHAWPRDIASQLSDSIRTALLFIFFELYNRKINSPEFARVKGMLDGNGFL
jgi:hypothetical protein